MIKETVNKSKAYVNHYGFFGITKKVLEKASEVGNYSKNRPHYAATKEELERQRNATFPVMPRISIIIPAYNPEKEAFRLTLESVKNQTYSNWQLCISDGGTQKTESIVNEVFGSDERVSYVSLSENLGISGNTNEAIRIADGEYLSFFDHDDLLEPDALFETAGAINNFNADMVYTDEDKVSDNLQRYFDKYCKPDYNKELILSNNYICHFFTVRKSMVEAVGGLRSEYDGAQDYDLILRCIELSENVAHINKVLYHWRASKNSTSDNPFNKEYAYNAGKRALEDYIKRNRLDATVESLADPGFFKVVPDERYATCKIFYPEDEEYVNDTAKDYVFIARRGMKITSQDMKKLVTRAKFSSADIVVPKITASGRYLYNGIAGRGKNHTDSLKGKPEWFKGKFNLAVLNMAVKFTPKVGILVKSSHVEAVLNVKEKYTCTTKGPCQGMKMVYAPEVTVRIQR